ncbi:MAG: primosomal protein N' [Chlamydiae bacterium RIFCSPHIGHO2_12_FULL_27_8]|nr:MAG: primosomal protein N' [Chlamydiae bacterium RIFCSPHIGHO2_12_FULL_27_8]OGN65007.1 MAG: primosomal protein N' [Chlamydiae bacterium RIFCSPLOWO2_01_FULL_28_7]
MSDLYASVVLETNIVKALDYSIPKELQNEIKVGMLLEVPLRNGLKKGFLLKIKDKTDIKKVLNIKRIFSKEVISKDLFELAVWMSKYYASNLSKVLKFIIPSSIRKEINPKTHILITSTKSKKELLKILNLLIKKHPSQAKAIEILLKENNKIFLQDLLERANISKSPIDTLIKKNIFKETKISSNEDILEDLEFFKTKPKILSFEQSEALDKIKKSITESKFQTHLLFGVTSSGKTEVFLQAIEAVLKENKSVIMLVPEVALTSQTIERFKSRFNEKIAVIHHKKSQGEKSDIWKKIINSETQIVIGARSAIFAPLKNLGLIIVDEEHDQSYKQSEEEPAYNAKHVAIMRAKLSNSVCLLASATPSIESYYNALNEKYILSKLTQRVKNSNLAKIHIVDMKEEILRKNFIFSSKLLDGIKKRYEKGEQSIIFLNRRGYNTNVSCTKCSYIFKCQHCDVSLTFHKTENELFCHQCNFKRTFFKNCPNCSNHEFLKFKGHGTELVEKALNAIFKNIKTLRIDRDTTSKKHSHDELFQAFKTGKADVLIGTQMVVKGLHFPSVTLVGILNTDSALSIPDFRSYENVFQLITQVAGRAGREIDGEVILQTFMPENDLIKLSKEQDYISFYEKEIENRKLFNYPPFTQMVKITFSSKEENSAKNEAISFKNKLIKFLQKNIIIHPVSPCGRSKIKDYFKFQFLIRGKILPIIDAINNAKKEYKLSSKISMLVDVDPINTYF